MRCPKCATIMRFLVMDIKGRRHFACDTHGQQYALEGGVLRPWDGPTAWKVGEDVKTDTFRIHPTLCGSQIYYRTSTAERVWKATR